MKTSQKPNFLLRFVGMAFLFLHMGVHAQQIGHTTVTFTDSARNNRQIPAEIYYPATVAGDNTPILSGSFPLIVFGHGFVMAWSAYQNIWTDLVPQGYIVVFPTTEGGFAPQHSEFGKDLRFLTDYIRNKGASPQVPVSAVTSKSAIMGHSMGGGATFLAADANTAITTIVTFAAANTNPSSILAATKVTVPTLIFSGTNDCITPPAQHQNIMYDSAASAYKSQINIKGGGHCYFADNNVSCSLGEATCTPTPAVSRSQQQSATSDFLKLWLGYYLKSDISHAIRFQDSLNSSNRITFRQNTPINQPVGINTGEYIINQMTIFPNPASQTITIETTAEPIKHIKVYDSKGLLILKQYPVQYSTHFVLDISILKSGIYTLEVNQSFRKKIVVN